MGNKLYYDNAIDALYMAEHFGVRFTDDVGRTLSIKKRELQLFGRYGWSCEGCNGWNDIETQRQLEKTKFYIAPESMEIFEPKIGDLILWAKNKYVKGAFAWCEASEFVVIKSEIEIIQRNNIPFITPKSEVSDV